MLNINNTLVSHGKESPASPIIRSILDTDAYKLHMQQAVYHFYPGVMTTFEFHCRNAKDHLGFAADAVREQVRLMGNLSLTDEEYEFLSSRRFLRADYLNYLRQYRFNPAQVTVAALPFPGGDGETDLSISIEGPWVETILWEVPLLAIVSEVVHRHRTPHIGVPEAVAHLNSKLETFFSENATREMDSFLVTDFGTRRRFSYDVQEAVVQTLRDHPQFSRHLCGTSNYYMAMRMNLPPVGTQAHEWFQAHQQLAAELRQSQRLALTRWLEEYPRDLLIALTDCISMDSFLKDFTKDIAVAYNGLRHDSGDPVEWGKKAVAHYRRLGIDPKTKTLVFSDSLDLKKAAMLYQTFSKEINVMAGIGTQLTCSIPNVQSLNIVLKMTGCEGKPVAKISDAPGKSICRDHNFVGELRRAFGLPCSASVLKNDSFRHA